VISQHFYTREKRGLYTSSAGYDTVAKSPLPDDSFVKEKIHPYCVYSGGNENAVTVAHFPCGKMLLSQAVFVPKDFSGQRTAFFAHNYILPAEIVGEVLGDMKKLLFTRFEKSCNENPKELTNLPLRAECAEKKLPEVGEVLHIVNCVIKSVQSAKKTYVILPENSCEEYVFAMLIEIYKHLPEGVKHLLNFCTNSNEPRKNIHLIFIKNADRVGDSRFRDDFVIDRSSQYMQKNTFSLSERIEKLPQEKFFTEINFWRKRLPHEISLINKAEINWLEKNFEKLQFKKIPSEFIKKGKQYSSLYVVLEILKYASSKKDISSVLGNYFLSPEDYDRTVLMLERNSTGS